MSASLSGLMVDSTGLGTPERHLALKQGIARRLYAALVLLQAQPPQPSRDFTLHLLLGRPGL